MRGPNPPVRAPKTGAAPSNAMKAAEEPVLEGSTLWHALTAIPRPHRKVPFPRHLPGTKEPVGEVAIWPLTQGEILEANAQADQRVKSMFKESQKSDEMNLGYNHSFANALAVQQLWRACRDPETLDKPAFPSPKSMELSLTGDEIGVLYNHYLTVQSEVGPITARMSDEEYEGLVRRIAEGGNADPFDGLSWDLQRTLVVSMACQLHDFWTATSSPGSQPDERTASNLNVSTSGNEQTNADDVADT